MQKLLLLILCILCFRSYSQIPNADFENWYTDSMGRLSPVDWDCSNTDISPATTSVFQDVGYVGNYSAKFISVPGSGVIAAGGYLNLIDYPYSNPTRPASLKGYWKVNNPGNNHDLFSVRVYLYNSTHSLIGTGTTISPTSSSIGNWTAFTSTINYTTGDPVSEYILQISWFPGSSNQSGYAYIDGLSFNIPTGINEFDPSNKLSLNQITAGSYMLNFTLPSQSKVNVELFDLTGRKVKEISNAVYPAGEKSILVDVATLKSGIYLCRYASGDVVRTIRLVKD